MSDVEKAGLTDVEESVITDVEKAAMPDVEKTEKTESAEKGGKAESADRLDVLSAVRHGAADPVKALMHRHQELCQRAVHPLEIAAGLEAHGVTDRTAARLRHRDVFSLAEEMYARTPRDGDTPWPTAPPAPAASPAPADPPAPTSAVRRHAGWIVRTLLPGVLCTAALTGVHLTQGRTRLLVAAGGLLAVALALRAALSHGPLSTGTPRLGPPSPRGIRLWTCWLVAYAVLGDGLLRSAVTGGPDGLPASAPNAPWPLTTAPLLAFALACAPAAWCARLLAAGARRRLTASKDLAEFAASVRPVLLGALTLFLAALTGLAVLTTAALDEPAAHVRTVSLGALLLLARLLTVHGFTYAPGVVLTAAATTEAAALVSVFAARLPHCDFLATPVQILLDAWGPGSVPTLACGTAALTLLIHANRTLTRASAHAPRERTW